MDATFNPGTTTMPASPIPIYVVDVEKFEDLYRREYPNLVAVARALTGDHAASEDLVQETMVKTFLHWRRLERYDRPGAWCLRVLTNACRDRWRRRQLERRFVDGHRASDLSVDAPSLELIEFWAAVRRLPSRPRLVVTLYYAGDRTVAEVASIVKVPEGTVKSDLARARVVLMAELER